MRERWKGIIDELNNSGEALGGLAFVCAIGWLAICIGIQFLKATPQAYELTAPKQIETLRAAMQYFDTSNLDIDLRRGDNLRIYIQPSVFEEIPYLGREEIITELGKIWCKDADLIYLPALHLYNSRDGSRLATHGCVWHRLWNKRPR